MILPFDVLIFLVLIATAILALHVKDLLAAVALLSAYSLFAALLFAGLLAVDVALVEAALGAGVTGVLFIAAIMATTRHSTVRTQARHRVVVLPLIAVFFGLMLWSSADLPARGDPDSPAQQGVSQVYLRDALEQTDTPNVVAAILADYRSQDTLGETLVILTAALGAALVLLRRGDEHDHPEDADGPIADPAADREGER